MSIFVVDASVAAKWFFPEVHSETALRLLAQAHTLYAPDLLFLEFGNVLWKRYRKKEITKHEYSAALEGLLAVPLRIQLSQALISLAVEIACAANCTVYDSLYLAAALAVQFPLVTADAKLYRSVSKGRFLGHIVWVGDIPE